MLPDVTHLAAEARFHAALWHDQPPEGLTAADATEIARRFAVYRNNVQHGLTRALAARFPVVERLVGPEFFTALARAFVAVAAPVDPVLLRWGDRFPAFLAQFPPVASLPYLPDVARLEHLRGQAYHAADAAPVSPEALAAAPAEMVRLTLHPSVTVFASAYPAVSIWAMNQPGSTPVPLAATGAEQALIARNPALDVIVEPIDAETARILAALGRGEPLAAATRSGDPTTALTLLLRHGLMISLETGDDA